MLSQKLPGQFIDSALSLLKAKTQYGPTIQELLMIQQQSDLLQEIAQGEKMPRSTLLSTEISQMSFDLPENCLHQTINTSISCIDLRRNISVAKFDENRSLSDALSQIRRVCSKKTYEVIREKISTRELNRKEKKMEREKQHNEELNRRCLKLTQHVAEYEAKIKNLETKIQELSQGKKQLSKAQRLALEKEEALIKLEKTILYKEKILAGSRKKLNAQLQLIQAEKISNEKIKSEIQALLLKLDKNGLAGKCRGKCWQGDIFDKCKENLNIQKRLMESQEETIERHYLEVKEITEIMKKQFR